MSKISGITIYCNDATNICYEASKSCYAGDLLYEREKRTNYIEKRVKDAHESVLEHSNNIYLIRIQKKKVDEEVAEFLSAARYLNVRTSKSEKNFYMLIGGSIRGYKNLIRGMKDQNNKVLVALKELIYESCDVEFFSDLVETHAMVGSRFVGSNNISIHHRNEGYIDDKTGYLDYRNRTREEGDEHLHEIINIDPLLLIYEEVKKYGFSLHDILAVCSVTVKFKNMSRIITQQLTRHRNGITQESQRYVDASGAVFNRPELFKPEKYDAEHKYEIDLSVPPMKMTSEVCGSEITLDYDKVRLRLTQQELGDLLCSIYPQLRDQGMLKEDARYYLPQAVQSSVYMTFTYLSLFQFFNLRLDKAAQAEIRTYAESLNEDFMKNSGHIFWALYETCRDDRPSDPVVNIQDMYKYYTTPAYMFSETYGEVDDSEISETLEAPQESMEELNKQSVIPEGDEEMFDFGTSGLKAQPVDKSDKAVEEMYAAYNPKKYEDTRETESE